MAETFDVRPGERIVVSRTRRLVAHDSFPRNHYAGAMHAGLPAGTAVILPQAAAELAAMEHEDVEIVDVAKGELPGFVSSAFASDITAWLNAGPATVPAPKKAPRRMKERTA